MAKYDLEVRDHHSERRDEIGGQKGKSVHKDASRSRVGEEPQERMENQDSKKESENL